MNPARACAQLRWSPTTIRPSRAWVAMFASGDPSLERTQAARRMLAKMDIRAATYPVRHEAMAEAFSRSLEEA